MKNKAYLSSSSYQTKKLASTLAKEVIQSPSKDHAIILALVGELGGGKTTFIKGFARALGIKKRILSPTFVIERKFLLKIAGFKYFYHFDCYRLRNSKEILNLGFKDIINNPHNIVAIEWADRVKGILPKGTIILRFQFITKNKRKIHIYHG